VIGAAREPERGQLRGVRGGIVDRDLIRAQTNSLGWALLAGNVDVVQAYLDANLAGRAGIMEQLPHLTHSFSVVDVDTVDDAMVSRARFSGDQAVVTLEARWVDQGGVPKIVDLVARPPDPLNPEPQPEPLGPEDQDDWPRTVRALTNSLRWALVAGNVDAVKAYLDTDLAARAGLVDKLAHLARSPEAVDAETAVDGMISRTQLSGDQETVTLETRWAQRSGVPKIVGLIARPSRALTPEPDPGATDGVEDPDIWPEE
jgi:hypothetical protein